MQPRCPISTLSDSLLSGLAFASRRGSAPLDGILIGSREMKRREQLNLTQQLQDNARGLPDSQARFCRRLARAVGLQDGFRRQAVPTLIYRYMADMRDGFRTVARLLA